MNTYKDSKFKEKIVKILISEGENDKSVDPSTGDYVDVIQPTEKIEIIYYK